MPSSAKTEGNEPMSQPENPSPDESEQPDPEDEQDSTEEASESESEAESPKRYAKARKLPGGGPNRPNRPVSGGNFFTIYKKGQGYWTRMGTAVTAALLSGLTASFVYEQVNLGNRGLWPLAIGIVVMAGLLLLCWWVMNAPGNADFLIATDSELKKVNWTKPADLMGSTKVVILFMLLIALFLFVCDYVLQFIFYWCIPGLPKPW
jgi:preprotein translocase subunit SecE